MGPRARRTGTRPGLQPHAAARQRDRRVTANATRALRRASFRLTVQQQHPDGTSDTVMDAQGEAFIAIVGTHTPSGRIPRRALPGRPRPHHPRNGPRPRRHPPRPPPLHLYLRHWKISAEYDGGAAGHGQATRAVVTFVEHTRAFCWSVMKSSTWHGPRSLRHGRATVGSCLSRVRAGSARADCCRRSRLLVRRWAVLP